MQTLAALLLLAMYLGFAFEPVRKAAGRLATVVRDWLPLLLLIPYLIATGFTPPLGDLIQLAIYLVIPAMLLRQRPVDARPFDLAQIVAILALWVPIEMGLFVLFIDLLVPGIDIADAVRGMYLVPELDAPLFGGATLPVHMLIGLVLAIYLFVVRHPVDDVGLTFRLTGKDVLTALAGLAAFAVVAIPLGLGLGFISFAPDLPGIAEILTAVVGGYLLVALMEEVLFRGIIQNLIRLRVKNDWIALPVASAVFGLAHLNNATAGYPIPNWAYVAMATVAGLAYGAVWMKTRKVTASAITHMLVNLLWGIVFV